MICIALLLLTTIYNRLTILLKPSIIQIWSKLQIDWLYVMSGNTQMPMGIREGLRLSKKSSDFVQDNSSLVAMRTLK